MWRVVDQEPEWDDYPDELMWDDCPPFETAEEAALWAWLAERAQQYEPEVEAA